MCGPDPEIRLSQNQHCQKYGYSYNTVIIAGYLTVQVTTATQNAMTRYTLKL